MRYFLGIDIGSEKHAFCLLDQQGKRVARFAFEETAEGYERLKKALSNPTETLIGMEATGHYWRNLFATLVGWEYRVVLLNPLATKRHAEASLARAKTDRVDAEAIARFLLEKRPKPTPLPSEQLEDLKELVRFRGRLMADLGAHRNTMHRLLDLVFPEFTRMVKDPVSLLALFLLERWPLAKHMAGLDPGELASEVYESRRHIGLKLAEALVAKAGKTVGRHQSEAYALRIKATVSEARLTLKHLKEVDAAISKLLDDDEMGKLLKSIPGIGDVTAAAILSEVGDPTRFHSPKQLVSFVGLAPRVTHSGKSTPVHGGICRMGSRRLRAILWMAALAAKRHNPTIRAFYDRLCERGKPKRVAIAACAAKLLHIVLAVLRRNKAYEPLGVMG